MIHEFLQIGTWRRSYKMVRHTRIPAVWLNERSRQTQCEEDLHRKFTKNLPRLDFKRSPFVSQPTAFLQISTFDPAWWVLKHNLFKDPVRPKVYCRWPLKSTSNTLSFHETNQASKDVFSLSPDIGRNIKEPRMSIALSVIDHGGHQGRRAKNM